MDGTIFGNIDLASVALWGFYGFFAVLIYYLQTENMREGYPLENDNGETAANQGLFPVPNPKTFKLPHGRGEVTVPGPDRQARTDLALEQTGVINGLPFEPTGDPMADGVGPGSWAARQDHPELDGKGHPKIIPMSSVDTFCVSAGRDPRGLPVMTGDNVVVGRVTDMWIDEPEQLVRYFAYEVDAEFGGGTKLVAREMARIKSNHLKIRSIFSHNVKGIPTQKSATTVTLLEEEKIQAYYGGGTLYADPSRLEPQA